MTEIKLTKRYPQSRTEDIVDAYMRGYEQGKNDGLKVGKQIVLGAFETYIRADRKTEPREQFIVVKDGKPTVMYRKTEPQNGYQTFNDTSVYVSRFEKTEKGGCTNCAGKDLCKNAFTEISQYCGAYEPQTDCSWK